MTNSISTTSELTRIMREQNILGVNIHFRDGEFRVHVRKSERYAFTCAQMSHQNVGSALAEHFGKVSADLSDLLE